MCQVQKNLGVVRREFYMVTFRWGSRGRYGISVVEPLSRPGVSPGGEGRLATVRPTIPPWRSRRSSPRFYNVEELRRAASVRPSARSPALEPRRFSLRQCHTRHPPRRNDPFRRDLLRPVPSRPQRILFPVDAFLASTVASTGGRITEPSAGVDTERRLTPLWQRESATSSRHTTKQLSTRRRRLAEGQGHTTASARQ